ncbi:hypothetical protein SALBM311S_06808 [Streptomyces alboniger]
MSRPNPSAGCPDHALGVAEPGTEVDPAPPYSPSGWPAWRPSGSASTAARSFRTRFGDTQGVVGTTRGGVRPGHKHPRALRGGGRSMSAGLPARSVELRRSGRPRTGRSLRAERAQRRGRVHQKRTESSPDLPAAASSRWRKPDGRSLACAVRSFSRGEIEEAVSVALGIVAAQVLRGPAVRGPVDTCDVVGSRRRSAHFARRGTQAGLASPHVKLSSCLLRPLPPP